MLIASVSVICDLLLLLFLTGFFVFVFFRLHMQGPIVMLCCCLVACSVVWALLFGALGFP